MGNEALEFEVVVRETVTYKLRVKADRPSQAQERTLDSVVLETKINDQRVSCIDFSHEDCTIESILMVKP